MNWKVVDNIEHSEHFRPFSKFSELEANNTSPSHKVPEMWKMAMVFYFKFKFFKSDLVIIECSSADSETATFYVQTTIAELD